MRGSDEVWAAKTPPKRGLPECLSGALAGSAGAGEHRSRRALLLLRLGLNQAGHEVASSRET